MLVCMLFSMLVCQNVCQYVVIMYVVVLCYRLVPCYMSLLIVVPFVDVANDPLLTRRLPRNTA